MCSGAPALSLQSHVFVLRAVLVLAALGFFTTHGNCDGLFGADSFFTQLYSDQRAAKPGDILHIIVAERATASHAATRGLKREAETTAGPGDGWLDFIKTLGYKGSHKSADSATATRSGALTARITVRVVEALPNGNLLVEGQHAIVVNKDLQTITLRGEVRPRDIRADNTVFSYDVANVRIEYQGSDPGRPGKRTGIISRILNLLF
jgi:flagellar L-ring protein precursor FlgH